MIKTLGAYITKTLKDKDLIDKTISISVLTLIISIMEANISLLKDLVKNNKLKTKFGKLFLLMT